MAVLGDSSTTGTQATDEVHTSWPGVFNTLIQDLGDFEVINFAYSARTLSRKTSRTFMEMDRYYASLSCQPDIVILALGGNDSKKGNWDLT